MKKLVFACLVALFANPVFAKPTPKHKSLEEVLPKTQLAFVAKVKYADQTIAESWQEAHLTVIPRQALIGPLPRAKEIHCVYSEAKATRYKDKTGKIKTRYPIHTGSGKEFNLRKGERVIVMFEDDRLSKGDAPNKLLRVESLANKQWILDNRSDL